MMHVIVTEGLQDQKYLDDYCNGWPDIRARLASYPPTQAGELTGVPAAEIVRLARADATTRPGMIRTLAGPEKHAHGGRNLRAIAWLPAVGGAWRWVVWVRGVSLAVAWCTGRAASSPRPWTPEPWPAHRLGRGRST